MSSDQTFYTGSDVVLDGIAQVTVTKVYREKDRYGTFCDHLRLTVYDYEGKIALTVNVKADKIERSDA